MRCLGFRACLFKVLEFRVKGSEFRVTGLVGSQA